jgi:hypothetical protein
LARRLPKLPFNAKRVPHALALRCRWCSFPIILVLHSHTQRRIPIEPETWDGSVYFISRKHRFHGYRCRPWLNWMMKEPRTFRVVDPQTEV